VTAPAVISAATRSGVASRCARASANAPSSAASIAIVSSRAVGSAMPPARKRSAPTTIQRSNTSAQATRITSLLASTIGCLVSVMIG
jgi:hypothetical protein